MILIAVVVSTLLWVELTDTYTWIVLLVTVCFGLIGFMDDYRKLTQRSHRGVPGKVRLAMQLVVALVAVIAVVTLAPPDRSPAVAIPFFKDVAIQLGWF